MKKLYDCIVKRIENNEGSIDVELSTPDGIDGRSLNLTQFTNAIAEAQRVYVGQRVVVSMEFAE